MNSTETYFKIGLYLGIFRNSSAFPCPDSRSGSGAGGHRGASSAAGGAPFPTAGMPGPRGRLPAAASGSTSTRWLPKRRSPSPPPPAAGSLRPRVVPQSSAPAEVSVRSVSPRAPSPEPRAPRPAPRAGHAHGRSRARAGTRTPDASAILAENGQVAAPGCDLAVCPAPGERPAPPGRSLGLRGADVWARRIGLHVSDGARGLRSAAARGCGDLALATPQSVGARAPLPAGEETDLQLSLGHSLVRELTVHLLKRLLTPPGLLLGEGEATASLCPQSC